MFINTKISFASMLADDKNFKSHKLPEIVAQMPNKL